MILELCRICPDLLYLSGLLQPELSQLLILLVLRNGHILLLRLVHARWWGTILHPLMHLHHALQCMGLPVNAFARPAEALLPSRTPTADV